MTTSTSSMLSTSSNEPAGSLSAAQRQTADAFALKWAKRDTFDSPESRARARAWLLERYGDVAEAEWWDEYGDAPVVLDAGCGAGFGALELLGPRLDRVQYLGVDASRAVEVARVRFEESGHAATFLRSDITRLPLSAASVDVILAEGVLHHTDDAESAFHALVPLLRDGGRFLFYVYRRKGPIREFTDDYLREKLRALSPQEAWDALLPLTRLGQQLGDMDVTLDLPDGLPLLDVPPGPITLQRFVYWHVFKAFHHPDLDVDELNHINYDWYAPANASRHTPEEVREWCASAGLAIERERVEEAGITVIATRAAGAG